MIYVLPEVTRGANALSLNPEHGGRIRIRLGGGGLISCRGTLGEYADGSFTQAALLAPVSRAIEGDEFDAFVVWSVAEGYNLATFEDALSAWFDLYGWRTSTWSPS